MKTEYEDRIRCATCALLSLLCLIVQAAACDVMYFVSHGIFLEIIIWRIITFREITITHTRSTVRQLTHNTMKLMISSCDIFRIHSSILNGRILFALTFVVMITWLLKSALFRDCLAKHRLRDFN